MRNLKKFLALVLAMMMTLSLMVTANAATSSADLNLTDSESVSGVFLEDIQVLTGMEVIKGYPDGSFKPQVEINRHQMATFIYRMTTGDTKDLKDVYLSEIAAEKFPDVKAEDSYAGYIGYCWVNGYIAGFPDGTFKPMNKVTGYQALVMILRAMGYNNPNDNFTGKDWQSLALSRARMNNLLVNIDKSVYSGTFSRPAPRELVAEMVFQGLIQPQVTYTTAMGYQKYGMEGGVLSSVLNPTLGYENFGLTNHKGIVVGNQSTGETTTKIGFSMDVSFDRNIAIGDKIDGNTAADWIVQGDLAAAAINDDISKAAYYYTSGLVHNNAGAAVDDYNVTLAFKWDSNLKLFNHAVDVWYDCRASRDTNNETVKVSGDNVSGSVTFPTNLTTYAVFDRVVKSQVVVAPTDALDTVATDNNQIDSLSEAVVAAGFTRRTGTDANKAFFNYAFAPMSSANWDDDATSANSAASPIKANNDTVGANGNAMDATGDDWPLYLVISNTPGNVADVVITLDMTLSKVVQDNNTQAPLSTGIWTKNGATGTQYFDKADSVTPANASPEYSEIANANRVDTYDAKLNDYVAALAVTGTTGTNSGTATSAADPDPDDATSGNATARTPLTSKYYYELTHVNKTVSAELIKYDKDTQQVVLGDGKTYERSIFALATDGSFKGHEFVMAPTEAGTYTFYLDEEGNWLYWEKGGSAATFVYGTYLDYTTDVLSSGFAYPMLYVNAAGEDQQRANNIYSITDVDGTVHAMNNEFYNNGLRLPKRTIVGGNSAGFVRGQYTGYIMTGAVANGQAIEGSQSLQAVGPTANATGFLQADNALSKFGDNDTKITATAVAIGAHPAGDDGTDPTYAGNLFLTSRTKFVVVTGAGTSNQKSTVYNGLAEFLGDSKSVTIDISVGTGTYIGDNSTDPVQAITNAYEMIYYKTEEDPYAQNYDQMDKHVETVFIPSVMIDREANPASGNLFFVGDSSYGLIDDASDATQYTFYQNGEKSVRWIRGKTDGLVNATVGVNNDSDIITELGNNVFYQLVDTGSKAKDGENIYRLLPIEKKSEAEKIIIGQYYGSTDEGVTPASTTVAAATTVISTPVNTNGYIATTRNSQVAYIGGKTGSDLFNVANANVLNLNDDYTVSSLGDLNDLSSLTSNQGVAVSCTLSAERTVSFIYVNY